MRKALLAVLPALFAVSACGTSTDQPGDGPPTTSQHGPSQPPSAGPGSLTVLIRSHAGLHGELYTEGSVPDIELRDVHGRLLARQTKQTERLTFRGLRDGHYRLAPAVRPCDGTCTLLDPRADGCTADIAVSGDTTVRVDFVVGRACTVRQA